MQCEPAGRAVCVGALDRLRWDATSVVFNGAVREHVEHRIVLASADLGRGNEEGSERQRQRKHARGMRTHNRHPRDALRVLAHHIIGGTADDGTTADDNAEDPSWKIFQGRAAGGNADDLAFTFDHTLAAASTATCAGPGAALPGPVLLTDLEVQRFIQRGHLVVNADFGDGGETHRRIVQRLDSTWGGPSAQTVQGTQAASSAAPLSAVNECRLPELRQVLGHPAVVGALTSLLGPGYIINQHHHIHLRLPGQAGQNWHKDAYPFDHNIRNPRFQWLFVLYYPHDVVEGHGPTAVLPGRAALESISSSDPTLTTEEQELLCVSEGSVALVDFDSWHRATTTTGSDRRYMLKFQAARMLTPEAPSWNHRDCSGVGSSVVEWPLSAAPVARSLQCLHQDVWQWLCGLRQHPPAREQQVQQRSGDLHLFQRTVVTTDDGQLPYVSLGVPAEQESTDIRAAFCLAQQEDDERLRSAAQQRLLAEIVRAARDAADSVYEKVASNGHGNNIQPPSSALALAAMGDRAVPAIVEFLLASCRRQQATPECSREVQSEGDVTWLAIVHVLTALGLIAPRDPQLKAQSLLAVLSCIGPVPHSHWWVRRSAVEALGRMLTVPPRHSSQGVAPLHSDTCISSSALHGGIRDARATTTSADESGPTIGVLARRKLVDGLSDPDRRVRRASAISIAQLAIARRSWMSCSSSDIAPEGDDVSNKEIEAVMKSRYQPMLREAARAALEQMLAGDGDDYNHFYAALALEAIEAEPIAASAEEPLHNWTGEAGLGSSHSGATVTTWEISLAAAARVGRRMHA